MTIVAEAKNLKAYYITQAYGVERTVKAVDDISIQIREGEIYGIAGESGCGKSTLLKVLLGAFEPPLQVVDGSVTYSFGDSNIDVLNIDDKALKDMRWRQVSYVPQGSMHVLNPVRRIQDIFHDFISIHRKISKKESYKMTREYLRGLGLPEKVMSAYPHQLSGGMRQRVTIALATILWPNLVFADEPTTALDVVVQRGVIELLKDIKKKNNTTLVIVTHDMGVHANLADRIAVLYAGKLVEEGDTHTIFKNPRHPYTKFLIQSLPKMDDKGDRISIPGSPPALDDPPTGCRFHTRCALAMDICRHKEPALIDLNDNGNTPHRVACFLESEKIAQ